MSVVRVRPIPPELQSRRWSAAAADRAPGPARLGSVLALLAAILVTLAGLIPALGLISRDAWLAVSAPGPAELGTLVTALAGPIALVIAAWLLVAIIVATADALLRPVYSRSHTRLARSADWDQAAAWFEPPAGQAARSSRYARAIAPALLRHAIAALLGVTLLSSPAMAAQSGTADSLSTARSSVSTSATAVPGWMPIAPFQRSDSDSSTTGSTQPGSTHPGSAHPGSAHPGSSDSGIDAVTSTGRHRRLDDDGLLVVHRGDTLWSIAARSLGPAATEAQIAGEWPRWFKVNRAVIGNDPDHLTPGQRLRPPAVRGGRS